MVIPDYSIGANSPRALEPERPFSYTARPADRVCAQIIDLAIFLLPLVLVVSAPIKKHLTQNVLVGFDAGIFLNIFLMVTLSFLIVTFYQTVAVAIWGTTIGKKFFHLKVVDIWTGGTPDVFRCLLRAAGTQIGWLFCGLPFLTVFSNNRRRTFHDLISDTEVISESPTRVSIPSASEVLMVRTIYAAALGIALTVFTSNFIGLIRDMQSETSMNMVFDPSSSSCESVDQAFGKWPTKASRLQVSMSLYAAGLVDKSCLSAEVDAVRDSSMDRTSLYYLASAFAHDDDRTISDAYLNEVCKLSPDSNDCRMSRIVSAWAEKKWKRVDHLFSGFKATSAFTKIWAIRHYLRQGQVETAYRWIESITPNRALASYLQIERTKALWKMERYPEAKTAATQALESLPTDGQVELASWMCVKETARDCSEARSVSCRLVSEPSRTLKAFAAGDDLWTLARLRTDECGKLSSSVNYSKYRGASSSSAFRQLLRGAVDAQKREFASAKQIFEKIFIDAKADPGLRTEAFRRYLQYAGPSEMTALVKSWKGVESQSLKRDTGDRLFAKLIEVHQVHQAIEIGRELRKANLLAVTKRKWLTALEKSGFKEGRLPASIQGSSR